MVGSCNESSDCQTGGSSLAYCHSREKSKIINLGVFKNNSWSAWFRNSLTYYRTYGLFVPKLHCGNAVSSARSITDFVMRHVCCLYVNYVDWGKYHLELNLLHYVSCSAENFTLTIQIFNNASNISISRLHRKSFVINQGDSALLSEAVFEKAVNCTAWVRWYIFNMCKLLCRCIDMLISGQFWINGSLDAVYNRC